MSSLSQFKAAPSAPDEWRVFPRMFGNGLDGDLVIAADTDGGCAGAFGFKQLKNLTINSGVFLQAPAGSGNGGLIIAVNDTLTINGGLRANGANATSGNTSGTSGQGGSGAGGTATSAPPASDSVAFPALQNTAIGAGSSGGYGSYLVGTASSSKAAGADASLVIPSTLLDIYRANGLPYQQAVTSATAVGLGVSADRSFSRFALLAGAARGGGLCTSNATGGGRACAGGGGGGGGLIYIAARHIVFGGSGTASATGGAAGDGASNTSGWLGGRGLGGHGGRIVLICESYTGTPTMDVIGGLDGRDHTGSAFSPTTQTTRGASGEASLIIL